MERESSLILHLAGREFQSEIINSDIPVFVDFYADWCYPCRMIAPTIEKLSKDYTGRVKFVKVDVDENPAIAGRYNVMGIPTVMIFVKGKPVETVVGAASLSVYKTKIDIMLGHSSNDRASPPQD